MLRQRIISHFTDGLITTFLWVLLYGAFFPLLGMTQSLVAPLYIGSVVSYIFFFGYGFVLRFVFDLTHNRFIDYHLTLPLPKKWLFAEYITYFVLELLIVTIPLMSLGIILLNKYFSFAATRWGLFIICYLLMLILFSCLFLCLSYRFSFKWFMENTWPRILSPLFTFGTIFFVWKDIYKQIKPLAILILFNPTMYCAEGIRAALFTNDRYISVYICIGAMILFISIFIPLLHHSIKNRLDPV